MTYNDASPITVLRPDDLLLLRFHFHGLRLKEPETSGQPWLLVKNPPNEPKPLIIVEFPPQSIGEESFFETVEGVSAPNGQPAPDPADPGESETPGKPGEVRAKLSGPTWLVFNVANQVPVPYTLTGLLAACANGNQVVSVERRMPPDQLIRLASQHEQGNLFSRIEVPYHLVLSPEINTTWRGRGLPKPNAAGTRTELWHVSMLHNKPTPTNKHPKPGGKLRAVWAIGFNPWPPENNPPPHLLQPFRMPLDDRDRYELVRLTTDVNRFYTKPIEADQLILSTMGAWFKAAGAWDLKYNPPGLSVTEWKHRMTMGRDHFVRVVYKGYLFPFGHEASLVKITERKIQNVPNDNSGQRAAYLRTRMFVIVRQPTLDYNYNGFPFRKVTLKTLVTPGIDPPENSQIKNFTQDAFWIRSGESHVLFHVVADDHENRQIEFTTPLAFVSSDKATGSQASTIVANAWTAAQAPSGLCSLGGQSVAFMNRSEPNDTTLETKSITLGAEAKKISNETAPLFRPTVTQAEVDIPTVKQLLGTNASSTIVYEDTFRNAPVGQFGNPADIFARVTSTAPKAQFKTEQAGGLVKPDFAIEGLSRSLGTVPQINAMVTGDFNPTNVFPDIKLLGGIQLNQIVNQVIFKGAPEKGELVPHLTTKVESGVATTRYWWHLTKSIGDNPSEPDKSYGELIDTGLFSPDIGAELEIISEVCRPLDGAPASFLSTGRLTKFHIILLPPDKQLIDLYFDSITFTARSGQKTDVAVKLKTITFLGPLSFVNALTQVIPLDGFSDPPNLNIDANGVGLGYTLAIPNVGIGVFSLQNLSLSAGFYLPFGADKSNVQLAFCTRENPGQVLVSLFGGGVFFGITLDTAGVQAVEMAMEFGAGISLNLGVASGSVTVMGGVYFQKSGIEVLLSAYIRMVGKVSVLGLISITVEFYLALGYLVEEDKLFGVAALKVKVKIAFFSKTVTLEVRREFKGSDPTFRDVMALPDWQDYCDVFGD